MRSVTTADFKQNTIVHVQESVSLHRNLLDSAGLTQNFRQAEEEKLVAFESFSVEVSHSVFSPSITPFCYRREKLITSTKKTNVSNASYKLFNITR